MKIDVFSAGGIVLHKDKICLVFQKRDDWVTGWAIPKGKIKEEESAEEAALREVSEETGLSEVKLVRRLGEIIRPESGSNRTKHISVFLLETGSAGGSGGEFETKWFSISEAVESAFFKEEAEFIKEHKNEIIKTKNH